MFPLFECAANGGLVIFCLTFTDVSFLICCQAVEIAPVPIQCHPLPQHTYVSFLEPCISGFLKFLAKCFCVSSYSNVSESAHEVNQK